MHAAGPLPSPSLLHMAADEAAAAALADSREDADSREAMQRYNNLAFLPAPPAASPGEPAQICPYLFLMAHPGVTHAESFAGACRTSSADMPRCRLFYQTTHKPAGQSLRCRHRGCCPACHRPPHPCAPHACAPALHAIVVTPSWRGRRRADVAAAGSRRRGVAGAIGVAPRRRGQPAAGRQRCPLAAPDPAAARRQPAAAPLATGVALSAAELAQRVSRRARPAAWNPARNPLARTPLALSLPATAADGSRDDKLQLS